MVLSSVAAGVVARGLCGGSPSSIAFLTTVSLIAWGTWALVTFEIGARLLSEPETSVDVVELLRTLGFAAAPGTLCVFGILPGVAVPVFVVAAVWMLPAMIVAVREALDFTTTGRAGVVCALGWVLSIAVALVLGLLFGPTVS